MDSLHLKLIYLRNVTLPTKKCVVRNIDKFHYYCSSKFANLKNCINTFYNSGPHYFVKKYLVIQMKILNFEMLRTAFFKLI